MYPISRSFHLNTFHWLTSSFCPTLTKVYQRILFNPLSWSCGQTIFLTTFTAVMLKQRSSANYFTLFFPILGIGISLFGLTNYYYRKRLRYEITLLHEMVHHRFFQHRYHWWDRVHPYITLGAIPLKNRGHQNKIKADAILMIVRNFEIQSKGWFSVPVSKEQWAENQKTIKQIAADDFKPLTIKQIDQGVDFIHAEVQKKHQVYVHCKGGKGRSAIIVVSYFIKHEHQNLNEAIRIVKNKRPQLKFNSKQKQCLKNYAHYIQSSPLIN